MENKVLTNINDAAYQKLIDNITALWSESKAKAITAVNTELLEANWQTGKYIVEYELKGKDRAEYGKQLLVNLAKDLTARNGKGFSRSNLVYMRKFYLAFPICETVSHKLTWSHYFELLKCDNSLEMQFYYKECIKEGWKVRKPCCILLPVSYNIQFILFAKIVPASAMKVCFQIAERRLSFCKDKTFIRIKQENPVKFFGIIR